MERCYAEYFDCNEEGAAAARGLQHRHMKATKEMQIRDYTAEADVYSCPSGQFSASAGCLITIQAAAMQYLRCSYKEMAKLKNRFVDDNLPSISDFPYSVVLRTLFLEMKSNTNMP